MAVGLTTIVTSAIELLFGWSEIGNSEDERTNADASVHRLFEWDRPKSRAVAEQSMDDFMRRIEYFPVVLMALRLLDVSASYNHVLKGLKIATTVRNRLAQSSGDLLFERREEARESGQAGRQSSRVADRLEAEYPDAANVLKNETHSRTRYGGWQRH